MIDADGFRPNVGMVVVNDHNQLLWCRRIGKSHAWQFPQGGIQKGETPRQAMYRELQEELGLLPDAVECLAESRDWLSYILPKEYRRYRSKPLCIGQKQKWFLLRLNVSNEALCLEDGPDQEFDKWSWVDYWYPQDHVISFKQDVYRDVLREFASVLGIREVS